MQAMESLANPTESLENSASERQAETAPAQAAEPPLPRRFERYTLLKRLARGGMGEVLLASSGGIEGAERPVVVKIIRREHETDRSFLARFLDEARIQAQLHHPGVAQILEATSDSEGKPFVVVEHVEGRNLSDVRSRASQLGVRISWPEAVALGIMLGEALHHVHERTDAEGKPLEIVHRDLSPQNVMVGYGGELKLIDFGTARAENRRCHTVAGIVFAKPGYVAPEVANNTPGGAPSDLYAFGIMLWELVAGRRFLIGESSQHMALVGAGKRNPTPLAQLIGAPPELDQIILKLTATAISDRYEGAGKAVSDLGRLLQRAPSMADGDRSVRGRVSQLMRRLYPAEPARSRAEFARLVAEYRAAEARPLPIPASPEPPVAEPADPSLLAGTPYKLLSELGRGSMGVVYQAMHLDLSRTVALKVMDPDKLGGSAVDRFRAEARSIAGISHENLIKVFDFGVAQDGRPYYAMEYLVGESLERKLAKDGELPYREAVGIALQAARALAAAHGAGVLHRDVKPGNLLLTAHGVVKLFDFGLAVEPQSSGDGEALHVVGTPEYMAPEQAQSGTSDARSDIYALGAVLYELVTGYQPHVAKNLVELIDLKLRIHPLPPSERRPEAGIPKSLDALLRRMLSVEPSQRPQSALELCDALDAILSERVVRSAPATRRRGLANTLVAGMSVLVLGVGGAALAKTPAGIKTVASVKTAYEHVVKLRADALAHRAPPAPVAATVVIGTEPSEPVVAPAAPPIPAEPAFAANGAAESDDEGEVEAADAPPSEDEAAVVATRTIDLDEEEPEVEIKGAPTSSESSVIEKADALWEKGGKLRALAMLKRAAKKTPNDAGVQKALVARAEQMGEWGEAVKAARRWALLDPTSEARLSLARLERATGHKERAVALVEGVMKDDPTSPDAKTLLGEMRGQKLALSQ
ncbi:MAG: Serine/threonine-protein kinase PknB [Polyangiaceae bacterium]|jgi:serine/threonine-protein kinase|nr:Serine/threonine-protein kinase PknB [Polyangiaceae bacterium]